MLFAASVSAACGSAVPPTAVSTEPLKVARGTVTALPSPPAAVETDAALAVGLSGVLLFGGTDSESGTSVGTGAAYDFASERWIETGKWPFDDPFSPGTVATDRDRYVVVGMPCPGQTADQDTTNCGRPVEAAVFDATAGEWKQLPAPEPGRAIDEASNAVASGLGLAGNQALFRVGANEVQVVSAFDVSTEQWSTIALPEGYALSDYSSESADDPEPDPESSNLLCVVDQTLVAARVSVARSALLTWEMQEGGSWSSPAEHPIGDLRSKIGELRCGASALLFVVAGGADVAFAEMYEFNAEVQQWAELPLAPTKVFDPTVAVASESGTLVLWPATASDRVLLLGSGQSQWVEAERPLTTPVELYELDPSVADAAVLAKTNNGGALRLYLYGV
jgi:hypothetical protein